MHTAENLRPSPIVLVDGYFIDRPYGFGRYVRELLHALDQHARTVKVAVVVPRRGEAVARRLLSTIEIHVRDDANFIVWEQVTLPRVARSVRADVVHFPYQSMSMAWPRSRSVLTVHDLLHLGPLPRDVGRMDQVAHVYRKADWYLAAKHARAAVAVSEATAKELSRLGIRSTVVPNIVDSFVSGHPGDGRPPQSTYFLHRGGDAEHKNTPRVLEAFADVRRAHPDVELIIFGLGETGGAMASKAGPGVKFVGGVDDEALAALYRGAAAVVIPSVVEGFGLAIIEAFGFGTPVITSTHSPMSDLAGGGAGLLVDARSVEQIADAMRRVLEEPDTAREVVTAGTERYANYRPEPVAAALEDVYLSTAQ